MMKDENYWPHAHRGNYYWNPQQPGPQSYPQPYPQQPMPQSYPQQSGPQSYPQSYPQQPMPQSYPQQSQRPMQQPPSFPQQSFSPSTPLWPNQPPNNVYSNHPDQTQNYFVEHETDEGTSPSLIVDEATNSLDQISEAKKPSDE